MAEDRANRMSSSSDQEKLYQPYQAQKYGTADSQQWHGEDSAMEKDLSRSVVV